MNDDERMDGLRSLAGALAHDLNNLFMALSGNVELLQMDQPAGTMARECLDDIAEASRRGVRRCNELMVYAGRRPMANEPVDLGAVVTERVQAARTRWTDAPPVDVQIADALPPVVADPHNLACSIDAILESAHAALANGGRVTLSVELDDDRPCVNTRLTFS